MAKNEVFCGFIGIYLSTYTLPKFWVLQRFVDSTYTLPNWVLQRFVEGSTRMGLLSLLQPISLFKEIGFRFLKFAH